MNKWILYNRCCGVPLRSVRKDAVRFILRVDKCTVKKRGAEPEDMGKGVWTVLTAWDLC